MKMLFVLGIAALAACGGSDKKPLFTKPAGTVAVGFSVDDTANKVFTDGQMQWKGSMKYEAATNKVAKDSTWGGPWAPLYDDGPWTAGGHEPAGATAGDHIFGTVVFVTPPATGSDTYEYGLVDHSAPYNDGWIWSGSNGTFAVAAGATADQKADGISLKKFGTNDIQLVIDKNALIAGTWDSSKVTVKGSGWAWFEVVLKDDGTKGDATAADGKFTLQLSQYIGAGKDLPHTGLLNSGDQAQFVFVFNGKEYKNPDGSAAKGGITAGVKAAGASTYTPVTIANQASGDKNTYITVP